MNSLLHERQDILRLTVYRIWVCMGNEFPSYNIFLLCETIILCNFKLVSRRILSIQDYHRKDTV